MKILKHSIKVITLVLIVSLTSCGGKVYPELEDGLYAEFITNKDTMVAKLFFKKTPVTVANFVALAEGVHPMVNEEYKDKLFYNGLIFHRVIDNFMIQGGDPLGNGSGSPGYKFGDEFDDSLKHDKPGILSMANSGPATNGSQFFITEVPTPHLDNKHTIFGELVKGQNIQDSISKVHIGVNNKPIIDVVILKLNIIRKGFEARKFDAVKTWKKELPLLEEREKQKEEAARLKAEEASKLIKEKADQAKELFIKENENLKGTIKHFPSGLTMIYTEEGNGKKPSSTEFVLVNYSGYFEDGQCFDTSIKELAQKLGQYNERKEQRNGYQPFRMIYNETASLVPGFREAMLNMKVGDKARVFIPSYLGYGEQGAGTVIPPNTNIIFDLEIVGIAE